MEESEQLKCACVRCGYVINYQLAAVGQIVQCPTCGKKSQLPAPPVQPKWQPPVSESDQPGEPPAPVCPTCGERLGQRGVICYKCETRRRRKRTMLVGAGVGIAALLVATAAGLLLVRAEMERRKPPPPLYTAEGAPTGLLPQPKVPLPKSLDNLKVKSFVVQKRGADGVSLIVGDIENISENTHLRVSVELGVLDAQGATIATLKEEIVALGANQVWHVVARTSDPRAAGVRVLRLREAP